MKANPIGRTGFVRFPSERVHFTQHFKSIVPFSKTNLEAYESLLPTLNDINLQSIGPQDTDRPRLGQRAASICPQS